MKEKVGKLKMIGSKTRFGKIAAIANISGERYYFMIDKHGTVSMMPAIMIEKNNLTRQL